MQRGAGLAWWGSTVLVLLTLVLVLGGLLSGSRAAHADGPGRGTETKIEIKITGTVSPSQRSQIEDLLTVFGQQNPHLSIKTKHHEGEKGKEKEGKAGKYLFFPLTAAMLGAVMASTLLAQGWRKARYSINLVANVATAAAFAFVAASGLLLIFDVKPEDAGLDIKFWHVVIGTVFVYLILFHLVNNWRAWLSYGRRLGRSVQVLRGSWRRPPI